MMITERGVANGAKIGQIPFDFGAMWLLLRQLSHQLSPTLGQSLLKPRETKPLIVNMECVLFIRP